MSSAAAMPGTPPEDLRAKRRMALIGGSLGNLVEWYDWFIYASFAIYFADSFFPGDNPTTQLMNTAGIFAVGFLMRPVGGWVLGRAADRHGRKSALTLRASRSDLSRFAGEVKINPHRSSRRFRRAHGSWSDRRPNRVPLSPSRSTLRHHGTAAYRSARHENGIGGKS